MRGLIAAVTFLPFPAFASTSQLSVTLFGSLVFLFLFIIWIGSKHTKSAASFYAAKSRLTSLQNGLAIAGDYISGASLMGLTGLIWLYGFDGILFAVGFFIGWPLILLMLAERLRNLGRFTFADITSYRLAEKPLRLLSSVNTLSIVIIYLLAQMVGLGALLQHIFQIEYSTAVLSIGMLFAAYLGLGGYKATNRAQIIKTTILLVGASLLAVCVFIALDFNLKPLLLVEAGNTPIYGQLLKDPISGLSLGLALFFGAAGLPHILMRFFTLPDAKQARTSAFYATSLIGYFYVLVLAIGLACMSLIPPVLPDLTTAGNEGIILLTRVLDSPWLTAMIAAVAFTTMLAVVAGLTQAGATAISYDLYANLYKSGRSDTDAEIKVSRVATVSLALICALLALAFESQNIAYLVALAFTVSASSNFPVLVLSLYWSRLTTRGATLGGWLGLITALTLIVLGPQVWVAVFGFEQAIFPWAYPALFSMPLAFITMILVSLLDFSPQGKLEQNKFQQQQFRSLTGVVTSTQSEEK